MNPLAHEVALLPDEARAKIETLYRKHGCHMPHVAKALGVGVVQLYRYLAKLDLLPRLQEIHEAAAAEGWLRVRMGRRKKETRPRKRRSLTPEHKAKLSRANRRT